MNSLQPINQVIAIVPARLAMTVEQQALRNIVLVVMAAVVGILIPFVADYIRSRFKYVDVTDDQGKTYNTDINKFNGKATVVYSAFLASGDTVQGTFTNGRLNGQGKIISPIGNLAQEEGEFQNGELHGHGKRTFRDGWFTKGYVEEGKFENGKFIK